jgi:hypothetical protein
MRRHAPAPRPRFRGDDGATIVEAAFILPIFILIVLGLMEFGLIFRDVLTIRDVVGVAARTGAVQGPDMVSNETADFSMVEDIREGTAGIPVEWIERIVIYEARTPSAGSPISQLAQACKTGGTNTARKCNVYDDPSEAFYAVQQGDTAYFQCLGGVGKACGYNPETRDDGPVVSQIDYVGVYIKLDREQITKMFGDRWTIEEAAIMRLEPGTTG